ncbi:hypothetical protein GCM10009810_27230 [Nostocoides vanveenii]|uniref:Uncharacterized protein n=1 Tax=Nostocoides vanveenii TaxID=330835 RepID=A0ABP4X3N1_9MICO
MRRAPQSRSLARRPLGVLAGSSALALFAVTAAPAGAAGSSYVALGDSYSSGVGTRTYINDGHVLRPLGLRLPEPDRQRKGLRAQLPRVLRGDRGRRHEHATVRADDEHGICHDVGGR